MREGVRVSIRVCAHVCTCDIQGPYVCACAYGYIRVCACTRNFRISQPQQTLRKQRREEAGHFLSPQNGCENGVALLAEDRFKKVADTGVSALTGHSWPFT